uniref:Uncharacterized protein n=1 Tax=Timema shepardi TaxID=629360 RepID=A0A7R9AM99_TIMSH|nr:unnamed protein product [Timema shepardi]
MISLHIYTHFQPYKDLNQDLLAPVKPDETHVHVNGATGALFNSFNNKSTNQTHVKPRIWKIV